MDMNAFGAQGFSVWSRPFSLFADVLPRIAKMFRLVRQPLGLLRSLGRWTATLHRLTAPRKNSRKTMISRHAVAKALLFCRFAWQLFMSHAYLEIFMLLVFSRLLAHFHFTVEFGSEFPESAFPVSFLLFLQFLESFAPFRQHSIDKSVLLFPVSSLQLLLLFVELLLLLVYLGIKEKQQFTFWLSGHHIEGSGERKLPLLHLDRIYVARHALFHAWQWFLLRMRGFLCPAATPSLRVLPRNFFLSFSQGCSRKTTYHSEMSVAPFQDQSNWFNLFWGEQFC